MSSLFNHPMVTHEQWENFTTEDHNSWKTLFNRQSNILKNLATEEILKGMEKLSICNDQIPKFSDINAILQKETGFTIVPVKGFIPEELFFRFLSKRCFPSTCFIRKPSQLDYIEEPDIFHDVFGHVPLLVNPTFASFMEEFGHKGLDAIEHNMLPMAAALYWFTVEFGLIKTQDGIKIYGAGITSSKDESIYSVESNIPKRLKFNARKAMFTKYRIDSLQKNYFVIDSFEQLFHSLRLLDWNEVKGVHHA